MKLGDKNKTNTYKIANTFQKEQMLQVCYSSLRTAEIRYSRSIRIKHVSSLSFLFREPLLKQPRLTAQNYSAHIHRLWGAFILWHERIELHHPQLQPSQDSRGLLSILVSWTLPWTLGLVCWVCHCPRELGRRLASSILLFLGFLKCIWAFKWLQFSGGESRWHLQPMLCLTSDNMVIKAWALEVVQPLI